MLLPREAHFMVLELICEDSLWYPEMEPVNTE